MQLDARSPLILLVILVACALASDDTFDDQISDYDAFIKAIADHEFIHTPGKNIARTRPCHEIVDKQVSFQKAVGRREKRLVSVSPLHTYDVAYCAPSTGHDAKCASESRCMTVYKWKPALTSNGPVSFSKNEILVPTGCMCYLGADKESDLSPLIIL